jgi:hypothetical protein
MDYVMGHAKDKTMSTPQLRNLLRKDGVRITKFRSPTRGTARVKVVGTDWMCWVTVVDPQL